MSAIIIILVLAALGVIFIGSIMGITSSGRMTKLETQNRNLNKRLEILEAQGRADTAAPRFEPLMTRPEVQAPDFAEVKTVAAPIPTAPVPTPVKTLEPALEATNFAPSKTAPEIASAKPTPNTPTRNLEELIGGQWSVWVGGLALLVGAVLLIRFSIEAGVFGPGARIMMALGLGVVLLLAGEWLKRTDDKVLSSSFGGKLIEAQKALQSNASIPGLLSAVGIFSLLGAIYAAFALYGLIPALVAFIGLGGVSLGAMALSLRQGPVLAAIGLLASLATPLLIQTHTPSFIALVGYLVVVGSAALALSQHAKWGWLATGTVFGWLGWSAFSLKAAMSGQMILWGLFLLLGFGVTVWRAGQYKADADQKIGDLDLNLQPSLALVWGGIAALLVASLAARTSISGELSMSVMSLCVLTMGVLFAASIFAKRQAAHLIIAGVMAVGLMVVDVSASQKIILGVAAALAVILALLESLEADEKIGSTDVGNLWPTTAIMLGIGSVVVSYIVGTYGVVSWSDALHAVWALAYCGLFGATAIYVHSKARPHGLALSLTVGAALAWALASVFALDGQALSLALSLGAAIFAAAIWALRLPGARLALLGLAGAVFAHALLWQFPNPDSLSARPIINALWIYLALPATILGVTGYLLHTRKSENTTEIFLNSLIEVAALAGVALFAVFQIRHLSNSGSVYVGKIGFAELGLQVSTGLCFTLAGLSKRFSGNAVLSKVAEIISYGTLALFVFGSLLGLSPLFNAGEFIDGNMLFNTLTTGMLVPTVLLGLCAWRGQGRRPEVYVNILGGLALLGVMTWMTAMVRYGFNGTKISVFNESFSDFELWTISAIWLLAGIVLLAAGVWKKEQALRIASGVIIIATVLKAFLVDMAGLEGVLRAMSFVVLGLVLIVIGRAYQRFWLSDRPTKQSDQKEDTSA